MACLYITGLGSGKIGASGRKTVRPLNERLERVCVLKLWLVVMERRVRSYTAALLDEGARDAVDGVGVVVVGGGGVVVVCRVHEGHEDGRVEQRRVRLEL